MAQCGIDAVMKAEAGDAVIERMERADRIFAEERPKASTSGFHRPAQLRPGPVTTAMSITTGPGAVDLL